MFLGMADAPRSCLSAQKAERIMVITDQYRKIIIRNRIRRGMSAEEANNTPIATRFGRPKIARDENQKHYTGSACKHCGGTTRFTSNSTCVKGCNNRKRTPRIPALSEEDVQLALQLRTRYRMKWKEIAAKFDVSTTTLSKYMDKVTA